MVKDLKCEVYGLGLETGVRVSYGVEESAGKVQPVVERVVYNYAKDGKGKVQRFNGVGKLIHAVIVGNRDEGKDAVVSLVNDRMKELGLDCNPVDVEDLAARLN